MDQLRNFGPKNRGPKPPKSTKQCKKMHYASPIAQPLYVDYPFFIYLLTALFPNQKLIFFKINQQLIVK